MKYMYSAITLLVFAGLLGCQPEQPAPTAPATTTQQPAATPTDVQGGSQKGLVKADPARAEMLAKKAQEQVNKKWSYYKSLAAIAPEGPARAAGQTNEGKGE